MKNFFRLNVIIFFLSISLFAQDNANQVLESLQNKYKSLNNFTTEFRHLVNNKVNLTGTLIYSNGNKIRVELKNSTIVSDGKSIWNYNKSKNQVVINNADGTDKSYFSLDKFLYEYPSKCSVSLEQEKGNKVLVLNPKDSGMEFKSGKLWINQDNLITKAVIVNLAGNETKVELSNYSLNKNVPDSRFAFSPPEGTKIIDLRK